MADEYDNLIKSGEDDDLGSAIQNLINDNLRFIKSAFLCKITKIDKNKVTIKPLLKQKQDEETLIINNCMVAFSYSQDWITQFKLKVGDIGVALVLDNDISLYKQNGSEGICPTKRFKDSNDSIYIPLALYKSQNNDDVNFRIENAKKNCKLEFNNSEICTLQAELITLKSAHTTLWAALKDLAGRLESMAGGQTAPDGHGQSSTTAPGSVGSFNAWASGLSNLFKE